MKARTIRGNAAAVTGALMLGGCAGATDSAPATVTETVTHMATATVTQTVEAAAETTTEEATTEVAAGEGPPFPVYNLGERFEFADSGLTVKRVEVLDMIETNDGSALDARDGEDLVLVTMHYENLGGSSVDLSCSGAHDLFMTAYDMSQREMEPVFETHRIPGNQPCNDALLSGQEADWNVAYRMIEGGEPMAIEIVATSNFQDLVVVNLTDQSLRFDA